MIVEVFKTDVTRIEIAETLVEQLQLTFPGSCINFDLEDCDNILRIQTEAIIPNEVIALLNAHGCYCEVLV